MSPEEARALLDSLKVDEANEFEIAIFLDPTFDDTEKGAIAAAYWEITGRR